MEYEKSCAYRHTWNWKLAIRSHRPLFAAGAATGQEQEDPTRDRDSQRGTQHMSACF